MKQKSQTSAISPARLAAFRILRRVEEQEAFASALVAGLDDLSPKDRALAQEITLGVLRWQREIDYFIARYTRRPVEKLDSPVRIALRLGVYQLRHLARIPPSAAVNESVSLVKRARLKSAAPMVNAALRNAARHLTDEAGEGIEDSIEKKSIEVSHPRWMLERWIKLLGEDEALALAAANNLSPPLVFRVNTLRADEDETLRALGEEGVRVEQSEFVPHAFTLRSGQASKIARRAASGDLYIQDEASQLVSLLVEAKPDHRILDLCAAPGSKSSHLAALTRDRAWIIACDLYQHRLATLAQNCQILGAHSIDAVAVDATNDLPFEEKFDRVLLDAPCSGTGTLRRNPEIKWRLTREDIDRLSQLQTALLDRAARAVAPRGRLVYSTCSVEAEENEEVIRRFLESGSAFRLIEPRAHPSLVTDEKFVRTFPHRHNSDGFFAAVMERID
ncbi:MAG: 16S rRNA (cytosine(967)-C(5))-methyltransferase RsmB [Acidobacteriota bacterium]